MSGYGRAKRRLLTLTMALLFIGGSLLILLVVWPLDLQEQRHRLEPEKPLPATSAQRSLVSVQDFGNALTKRFHKPTEDPPVVVPPKIAQAKPTPVVAPLPEVRLLGTASDSNEQHSMAWLKFGNAPTLLVGLGETLTEIPGQPVVDHIGAGTTILRFGERKLELEIKK